MLIDPQEVDATITLKFGSALEVGFGTVAQTELTWAQVQEAHRSAVDSFEGRIHLLDPNDALKLLQGPGVNNGTYEFAKAAERVLDTKKNLLAP